MDLSDYKRILNCEIIKSYLNFSSKKEADAEIVILVSELKKFIKKLKHDNLEDLITISINDIMHKLNCLLSNDSINADLKQVVYNYKVILGLEKYNLKKLLSILKTVDYNVNKTSEIYLYANALLFLHNEAAEYVNKKFKQDECYRKHYFYEANTDISLNDVNTYMIHVSDDINRLKIKSKFKY